VYWALGNLAFGWLVLVGGTWLEAPLRQKGRRWHIRLTVLSAIVGTAICVPLGRHEIAYIEEHAPPSPPAPYLAAREPSAISLFMETNAVDGATIIDCAAMDIKGPRFGLLKYRYFVRTSYDARSNALFVTYYIPSHPILAHDDNMLKIMAFIASQTEHQVGVGKQFFLWKLSWRTKYDVVGRFQIYWPRVHVFR